MNEFSNPNVESWFRFVWRQHDQLPFITFYFLSRSNPTSPRFFPLYENSNLFRIVVMKGLPFKKTDYISLKLFTFYVKLVTYKTKHYKYFAPTSYELALRTRTSLLVHLDDPTYSDTEFSQLGNLKRLVRSHNNSIIVVCTNQYTKNYLSKLFSENETMLIRQGFEGEAGKPNRKTLEEPLKVVYTSPSIDITGDFQEGHTSWDVTHFITEIVPRLSELDGKIQIHLVGALGNKANNFLLPYDNVVIHGLVSIRDCSSILRQCHVGLYPRKVDNKRSVQKIAEYIGAGLPVISYRHLDTSLVGELQVGVTVETTEQFIEAVRECSNHFEVIEQFHENVVKCQEELTWKSLALSLERTLLHIG